MTENTGCRYDGVCPTFTPTSPCPLPYPATGDCRPPPTAHLPNNVAELADNEK